MFSNILPSIRFPFRWTPTIKVSSKVSAAFLVIVWACFGPIFSSYAQACPTGTSQLIVVIRTDNYPRESSYRLQNQSGAVLAFRDTGYFTQTATYYRDTLCIPNTSCLTFTMMDSYGDGLCCGHGNGLFQLWWNGNLLASGGQFTHSDVRSLNCAPTQSCQTALAIDTGNYSAPVRNSWYAYTAPVRGRYRISTCPANPSFNTRIWVYNQCNVPVLANNNMGTVFFNDSSTACGIRAEVMAFLDTGRIYYVRIGGDSSCTGPIAFRLQYDGPIPGCMDPLACNYDPMATVSTSCYYYPNPLCPPGPDLEFVQSAFENSLQRSTINANVGNCWVAENCLTGYGSRTLIRFTTDIRNVGITDYFIGSPSTHPGQFNTVNCHGHAHYEGYAEYVLYPTVGNRIPVGFKNGFCVMDLSCPSGIPAKYGCSNMGITAGCGDIYSRSLDCQWIDITDVPTGDYILAAKVNWDQSPDALGRIEMNYLNNWAQVCVRIYTDNNGLKQYSKYPNCAPYTDCQGVVYGNAVRDCRGICSGTAIAGDINQDSIRSSTDMPYYLTGLVQQQLPFSNCADLSGDSVLNVWDAALLGNCLMNNNTGQNCQFPRGIQSAQTHSTKILAIDTVQRFVDIGIRNPQHRLTALDFSIHGIRPLQILSLAAPGSPVWQYTLANQQPRIIGISQNMALSIARDSSYQPLMRIFYSRTSDTAVYLQATHAAVNEYFENLITRTDSTRWRVSLDRSSINDLNARSALRLYPNPSQGNFTLEFPSDESSASYRILHTNGQIMHQGLIENANLGREELNLRGLLEPGLYLLEYRSARGRNRIRFLVQ
ncbi:MAG: lysyl oxidase family protein [Bacteroidota bacterium]